jgi:hypothetical protein
LGRTPDIECLRVALPDSRHRENVKRLGELANTYEFTRNGERVYATIRNIQPVDETKPAYCYARANGLFKSPKSVNGVLDLGGGTAIARLYTPSGSAIRGADVNVPGTFELASRINAALMPTTGQTQDLSLIMDAIANRSFTIAPLGLASPIALRSAGTLGLRIFGLNCGLPGASILPSLARCSSLEVRHRWRLQLRKRLRDASVWRVSLKKSQSAGWCCKWLRQELFYATRF